MAKEIIQHYVPPIFNNLSNYHVLLLVIYSLSMPLIGTRQRNLVKVFSKIMFPLIFNILSNKKILSCSFAPSQGPWLLICFEKENKNKYGNSYGTNLFLHQLQSCFYIIFAIIPRMVWIAPLDPLVVYPCSFVMKKNLWRPFWNGNIFI